MFPAGALEVHDMEGSETPVTAQGNGVSINHGDDGTLEREATDITSLTKPKPPKDFGMFRSLQPCITST